MQSQGVRFYTGPGEVGAREAALPCDADQQGMCSSDSLHNEALLHRKKRYVASVGHPHTLHVRLG